MADLSKLFVVVGAKTEGFQKGMDGVANKLKGVSKKMKIVGGAMLGAAVAIGGASLKMAADFDKAMREVNTMMLLNEEEFKAFSDEVREMARVLGVDAVDSAHALYQAISAGVPKENVIEFLEIATKAAIGGVTDTTTAVDGLTTVLNAFKMPMSDAQKVADIMFTTVKRGKTTFPELSSSMSVAAPLAATLGVRFEDLMAAVATLTKQGVPTSEAMNQVNASLVALTKPSTEMKGLLEKLGFESGEAMLQTLGYQGSLDALREAAEGNNEVLATAFGRVEGLKGMLGLTGENLQMAKDDMDAMAESTGAATDAFDQMEQSTSRQFEKFKEQLQDLMITLGTALMPILKEILDRVAPIIEAVGEWMDKHKGLAAIILGSVGGGGALLLFSGMLGNILTLAPKVIGVLVKLGAGFVTLGAKAFTAVAGLVMAAAAKIWAWASTIPIAGIALGIAGSAALAASIWGIKSKLASFAEGGIAMRPMLATVAEREPELIMPLSKLEAALGGKLGGGDTITNNFNGPWFIREEADINKVARELFSLQQRKQRSRGI